MASTRHRIHCPACDRPVSTVDISTSHDRAHCPLCGEEIVLHGYIEPSNPGPDYAEKAFRPLDMKRPRGLAMQRSSIPGVESFQIGSKLVGIQVRLERDTLVFKGLFGREQKTPIEQVAGFAAVQRVCDVSPAISNPNPTDIVVSALLWSVNATLTDGSMLRVWEYDERDHARYVASELNKALQFVRTPSTPYRG